MLLRCPSRRLAALRSSGLAPPRCAMGTQARVMEHPWVTGGAVTKDDHSSVSPGGCGEADERPRERLADDEGEEALPDGQGRHLGGPSDGGSSLPMRTGKMKASVAEAGRESPLLTSWKTKIPEGLARVWPAAAPAGMVLGGPPAPGGRRAPGEPRGPGDAWLARRVRSFGVALPSLSSSSKPPDVYSSSSASAADALPAHGLALDRGVPSAAALAAAAASAAEMRSPVGFRKLLASSASMTVDAVMGGQTEGGSAAAASGTNACRPAASPHSSG